MTESLVIAAILAICAVILWLRPQSISTLSGNPEENPELNWRAVRRIGAGGLLHRLSGAEHFVTTGVTLRTVQRRYSFAVTTAVRFRALADEEIAYYVDRFRPFDKAGGYGIQEWIGYVAIESINGSFYNVMGLPVQRLYVELDRFLSQQAG